MKWTTANIKNPNYTQNHEIYVGTHTGSFKKVSAWNSDNPFQQKNLLELSKLNEGSRITALEFDSEECKHILIGRADKSAQLHPTTSGECMPQSFSLMSAPVGLACYNGCLIGGLATGQVQKVPLNAAESEQDVQPVFTAGDDMSHMHQCPSERKLVATGGKGRQNNLKVFDIEAGKQIFISKNLPNDFLQLEVPVWDSDVGFIDANTIATCSRYGYVRVYDTRKQRRPVQCYATENQMSFATLVARDQYIYTGTTMGALKAFDIRRMKNFVHTYKGFTGSISDVKLDATGKYLASASLDRYVRVHNVDSTVLLYQCYVKSKVTRVLIRESTENTCKVETVEAEGRDSDDAEEDAKSISEDEEYNQIFNEMQTICENENDEEEVSQPKLKHKRKLVSKKEVKNKKKK